MTCLLAGAGVDGFGRLRGCGSTSGRKFWPAGMIGLLTMGNCGAAPAGGMPADVVVAGSDMGSSGTAGRSGFEFKSALALTDDGSCAGGLFAWAGMEVGV